VGEEGELLGLGEIGEGLDKLRVGIVGWLVHWSEDVKEIGMNRSDSTLSQILGWKIEE
jgi:hypothetical protein